MIINIDGVVDGPLDPDTFLTEFIKWIEANNWVFAGSIGPYKDDDDNEA